MSKQDILEKKYGEGGLMSSNSIKSWRQMPQTIENIAAIKLFEKTHDILLPEKYIEYVNNKEGIVLEKDTFRYWDQNNWCINFIGRFLCWANNNLYSYYSYLSNVYNDPPEFFPNDLIPFAPDGGGNYICFDYRNCREDPPIVYWDHGIEENEGIFHLADSFEEFLSMLKSEEEIVALVT